MYNQAGRREKRGGSAEKTNLCASRLPSSDTVISYEYAETDSQNALDCGWGGIAAGGGGLPALQGSA